MTAVNEIYMKLLIGSDFHFEFRLDGGKSIIDDLYDDVDAIVVAGDLSVGEKLLEPVNRLCEKYNDVIYTPGNHEFYETGDDLLWDTLSYLMEKHDNFHMLNTGSSTIKGINFCGCTLWFPRSQLTDTYKNLLSDFCMIPKFESFVYKENRKSMNFLNKNVNERSIVITHHLPSPKSVAECFKLSPLNVYFVCPEAENIITERKPKLWIHGHTHFYTDYMLGDTHVICNPMGYNGEISKFKTDLVVEI